MAQYQIRLARRDDIPLLPKIELEAATRFPSGTFPVGMENQVLPVEIYDLARSTGQLWVAVDATDRAVGFVLVRIIGSMAFIAELDVLPRHGRQGLGSALIKCVERWAKTIDLQELSLITFSHLAWNAPMYERLGFERYASHELPDEIDQALAIENAQGLQNRIAMYLKLSYENR
jgi:GNAT superfamily N-acetyltransferase